MVGRSVLLGWKTTCQDWRGCPLCQGLGYHDESGAPRLKDINFNLHAGEILGVVGVSGNGQSELLSLLSAIIPLSNTLRC